MSDDGKKFCKHCGAKIPMAAIICTACGCQVEEMKPSSPAPTPSIVVQNVNNTNVAGTGGIGGYPVRMCDKWIAILFCIFGGWFGLHKFYEGKVILGIIYFFTCGLFLIGVVIDFLVLLGKPNKYPVI